MDKLKIWFLGCALLAGTVLEAQTVRKMTLKDCMEYAISNSTQMRLQQADRDDERIARRDAILSAFTPSIQGSTYAYNYYGRNIDPETNTFVNTTSFNNGYSLSGGIMLFNGFQAINNLKISKTMMEMGLSKDQQAKDVICLTTMEAFYNAVYYAEMVKTMQIQVEAAEKSLALAQKQGSLGQKGHADVVQMEADLAPSTCWKAHRKRPCSNWCFGDEFFVSTTMSYMVMLPKKPAKQTSAGFIISEFYQSYSFGPAATNALPASFVVYFSKFLIKRPARSFAFSSQTVGSA